jgi:hypothetical protein
MTENKNTYKISYSYTMVPTFLTGLIFVFLDILMIDLGFDNSMTQKSKVIDVKDSIMEDFPSICHDKIIPNKLNFNFFLTN